MKEKLSNFINNPAVDIVVVCLIFASVGLLVAEQTVVGPTVAVLTLISDLITVIFVIELAIRFYVEPRKKRFVRKYWIDILAVLPLLRSLRFLRVLRLLRLLRAGALINRHLRQLGAMFRKGFSEQVFLGLAILAFVLLGTVGMRLAEPGNPRLKTFSDAFWWAVFSLLGAEPITGDPAVTPLGKSVTLLMMIGGITVVAMFTGLVAAVMVRKLKETPGVDDMDLEDLVGHVVICGWNRAGALIVDELQADKSLGKRGIVLVAEFDEEQPVLDWSAIDQSRVFVLRGDYTRMEVLRKARIETAAEAILLADKTIARSDQDRDARTVLASLLIEKLNKGVFTCVELLNRDNAAHLAMVGVEEVVVGDEYSGSIIASALRNRGLVEMLNELFSTKYGNQFYKMGLPQGWDTLRYGEVFRILKEEYGAILVSVEAAKGEGRELVVNPPTDREVQADDRLVIIASERIKLRPWVT